MTAWIMVTNTFFHEIFISKLIRSLTQSIKLTRHVLQGVRTSITISYNHFWNIICMYIYVIYICDHENNVLSQLSPQWLCGNSSTWAHDVLYIMCPSAWVATKPLWWKSGGHIVFIIALLPIYYAHLAFVRFELSVCRGSLMIIFKYIYIYIYIIYIIYIIIIYIYIYLNR